MHVTLGINSATFSRKDSLQIQRIAHAKILAADEEMSQAARQHLDRAWRRFLLASGIRLHEPSLARPILKGEGQERIEASNLKQGRMTQSSTKEHAG